MVKHWWKIASILLLAYTVVAGFLMSVPRLNILNESIRALYFHVPMWFGMIVMFLVSTIYAIKYLRHPTTKNDILSVEFANTGLYFGLLGITTGMIWANYTWGSPWHGDPKQNGAAIALLVYLAYFVLRGSVDNHEQRSRLSAVYNIFAFAAMVPLIFILPRMTSSMHPGSGGNPGFNMYDLDSRMRMVFYPAVAGWILLGVWIATLRIRIRNVKERILELEDYA
ncbi:MAG: cytochrome c biogenesis protein [Cyclobacteriaceae bacterium]|nr:cytochrome c biogenesis protein CcsA [Cyclobacteriaceae bacterium]MCB9238027.1 cytochrome c biogenesis protein CcsA [Flammeovirgaceae bacterium]MCB0499133.1 cytochrome c biogenesis protein CcsA [Cyclobacteriaceae bacterium]MCO5272935.1 cytochrome c biogenesis protein [Cyclobacteriaceae bacterium]MCW5901649.1 cytochrome c biogenesis protein CcsA [Cyclobacteriaceae bacterium]